MSTGIDVEAAVRTFMTACGQGQSDGREVFDLRLALIEEEYTEFLEALNWGDKVFIAKEACDLVYVVVGTLIALGIPFNDVFAALQQSNMTKVGPDGSVVKRDDGKILKGPDFRPAEDLIKEILR
jgi:predicted HAD superfamily Cof-like phosphohydrolase